MEDYEKRLDKAKKIINECDYILIGSGMGLSLYTNEKENEKIFNKHFKDFIKKYNIKDLYSGTFYPFKTIEEKWAFWSKMVYYTRYNSKPSPFYKKLFDLVKTKPYFIITTNVDHQFQLAGFLKSKLYYTQGDYGLFQCSVPCHNKTYDNKELVEKMVESIKNCKISSSLVPKCPVCMRDMEMNLRSDDRFVQDDGWYEHARLYQDFLDLAKDKKVVLIEIGVNYDEPHIIKLPFENYIMENKNSFLIRLNKDFAIVNDKIKQKTICFDEDYSKVIDDLIKT